MSRGRPLPGCYDLGFRSGYRLDEPAEVALEDYARVLTRAADAETVRAGEPARVSGVHMCALPGPPPPAVVRDLEAFAEDLAAGARASGLGWT